ncbi:hypothetical protein DL771_010212 [Monosporascus sp. 5C6A]|nr:hypothetical protein DL771_010212 [Monosporascus sp. 5C6A]
MADLDETIRMARQAVDAVSIRDSNKVVLLHNLGIQVGDRYSRTGDIADLNEATRIAREAVGAASDDFPERSGLLYNLGIRLGDRYLKLREIADLQEAIEVTRAAVKITTPSNHPYRARRLNSLAIFLGDRYSEKGVMADLDEAIQLTRQAIDAASNVSLPLYLNNLGVRLSDRYLKTRTMADLDEAVRLIRQAIAKAPVDHPERARWLNGLGARLAIRYSSTEAIADLDEAIQVTREAIRISPGDPEMAGRLSSLGNHLARKYSKTRAMINLEEAIQVAKQACDMTPVGYPNRGMLFRNLATHLSDRFSETGRPSDLEEAIQVTRDAVDTIPGDDPDCAALLQSLGVLLGDQYLRTRVVADLDEAIRFTSQAVDSTPDGHPELAMRLNNLGVQLGNRFSETGEDVDLERAIQAARGALDLTPADHPDRARRLNNLGNRLSYRYSRRGEIGNLNEAIQLAREATQLTPDDHPDIVGRLNNLGNHLGSRYSRTKAIVDLEEAIYVGKQAEHVTPDGYTNKAALLNNLGVLLTDRYARTLTIADLENAIQAHRQALDMTPVDRFYRAIYLNNLGNRLSDWFTWTGKMNDLEEAIKLLEEAVDITPGDHPDKAMYWNSLGIRLGDRHSRTQAMADLDRAIELVRQAVGAAPDKHPDLTAWAYNLGNLLSALRHESGPTMLRIRAGAALLRTLSDWEQAHEASSLAVSLIPRLTARSLGNSDRQHVLSQVVGLASNAAAAALRAGKGPLVALDLLEQGRGVLATSLEQLRTDLQDLRGKHGELAERFSRVRDELEQPVPHTPPFLDKTDLAKEFDELIIEIRKKRGFEHFLLPPSTSEMQAAAQHGPIAIINVSEYRCDALLVEQHQVRDLALPGLSSKDIQEKAKSGNLGNPRTLEWLWDAVARPVLDALGFTKPPPDGKWPHLWWIPTGLLTRFPLHAAGRHKKGSFETVLDRVMSSYSSTVKTIIHGRRYRVPPSTSNQVLLVAMEHTPGNNISLPFATKEVAMLSRLCESKVLSPIKPGRRRKDIVPHLQSCRIFHFAGHGHTDGFDPSNSHLCLEEEDNPLRVADLLDMNRRECPSFLAYLSACGTGRIKGEIFVDESIHLISAFQLAGFRHVIGTLWSVNDDICVDMAEVTYNQIVDGDMTDESVCFGLHKASRELRNRWLKGLAEARREGGLMTEDPEGARSASDWDQRDDRKPVLRSMPTDSLLWVPYVHFGV